MLLDTAPVFADGVGNSPLNARHTLGNISYDIFSIIVLLLWDPKCLEPYPHWERGPVGPHFPTTASHVCRRWRSYALGTPSLWSTLRFTQSNPDRTILTYQIWLARTFPDAPLDITIGHQPFHAASVKHAKAIMRLIMPHVGRWRSLRVDPVPVKIFRFIFDRWGTAEAPMLEVLKVFGTEFSPHLAKSKWQIKLSINRHTPSLKELVTRALPLAHLAEAVNTHLQVLRLTHPDFKLAEVDANVNLVHLILKHFPKLRALTFSSDVHLYKPSAFRTRFPVTNEKPLSRLYHSALTEIMISPPNNYQARIIESLALPSLRYILTPERLDESIPLALLPVISRHHSFPNLVCLRLRPNYVHNGGGGYVIDPLNNTYLDHLEGALQESPDLRALTFTHVDLDGGWPLLCLGRTCPRLRWLELISCTSCTPKTLRVVVESRAKRPDLDPLDHLVIRQWMFDQCVTMNETTGEWFIQSGARYRVLDTDDRSGWDDYLCMVEDVRPLLPDRPHYY